MQHICVYLCADAKALNISLECRRRPNGVQRLHRRQYGYRSAFACPAGYELIYAKQMRKPEKKISHITALRAAQLFLGRFVALLSNRAR